MGDQDALLKVEGLQLTREGYEILREVNLTVRSGSVHVVLGLNGSGKSTLAYTLMGCSGYTPDAGHITLDGVDITPLSITERARQGVTLAWQEPARFEGLTVARYLSLGMKAPDMARLRQALEAVALDPETYLSRYVDASLSGGERKRIELAAVYAMHPRLAILDEPDSGIDALSLDDIAGLIHRMALEGTTVLLISHRDEVVALADAASLICEGRIVDTGDPAHVCDRYTHCCQPCNHRELVEGEVAYV
ncbi:MAG: ABC transporter ATP-binding protein [Anaerolineae bacterium]